MKRLIFLSAVFLTCLPIAHAQLGIYAGYTASNLSAPATNWTYGPTFGAYFDAFRLPVINLGLDARASIVHSSSTAKIISGLIGPRAVLHLPIVPLRPYAEVLAGVAVSRYGQVNTDTTTSIDYGFAAGIDFTIFTHLDWRIIDFTYTRLQDTDTTTQKSLTTGLVLRIPFS